MSLLDKANQIKDGAFILSDWLGAGGIAVETELAQKRTNVCIGCNLNQKGSIITESMAKAIKSQMELKNHLELRTNGIKSLGSCQICSCHLPLKIFVPMSHIMSHTKPEELEKFPDFCWMRTENNL